MYFFIKLAGHYNSEKTCAKFVLLYVPDGKEYKLLQPFFCSQRI